jgi:hypothetical protein
MSVMPTLQDVKHDINKLIPLVDVMRLVMERNKQPKVIKRCEYDLNGCAYFQTSGVPRLPVCQGDGHYRCNECVNLTK